MIKEFVKFYRFIQIDFCRS